MSPEGINARVLLTLLKPESHARRVQPAAVPFPFRTDPSYGCRVSAYDHVLTVGYLLEPRLPRDV